MEADKAQSEITHTEQPVAEPMGWQASEFIHHQKQTVWYLAFVAIVVVLVAVAALTQQWFTVAVFIAMAGALLVFASKAPRTLEYELDGKGVKIDNKFYHYNQFRSFSVMSDVAWHSIELDPVQRFMPRLTILFDSKDFDRIVALLSQELPRVDRKPDLIEQITRKLKF